MKGDSVTVSITVPVPPDQAFAIFTEETDLWWRTGPRFRAAGREPGKIIFEAGIGGRILESFDTKIGIRVVEFGRITAWEPGARLAFEWRNTNFAPEEKTFVEVTFTPMARGTKVTVTHGGFAALRPDHPTRHGKDTEAFIHMMAMWWSDLMASMREQALRK